MKKLINQQILERLASLLRSESRTMLLEHGLQPVQFEALQYIANCNRYSDTPMAVTEFLGQTKGTVSQTLKVLEKKGLIEKGKSRVGAEQEFCLVGPDYRPSSLATEILETINDKH